MNNLMIISPYKWLGLWVFDDPSRGLTQEPFVKSVSPMINDLVESIPDAELGFRLTFSAEKFPGWQRRLQWESEENGGNWYYDEATDTTGWLCPALFKFFESPPPEIYVRADSLGG